VSFQIQIRSIISAIMLARLISARRFSTLVTRQPLFIVLDMDETLIHTVFPQEGGQKLRFQPSFNAQLQADSQGPAQRISVFKRPGLDEFVAELSRGIAAGEYEVAIFTAALKHYADVVLDTIDLPHAKCKHHLNRLQQTPALPALRSQSVLQLRYYRDFTVTYHGVPWVKELSRLRRPLERTVLVDNSSLAGLANPENIIPAPDFYGDPSDVYFPKLITFLQSIRSESDVRLALRDRFGFTQRSLANHLRAFPRHL
jgi:RNA polymerase II subunit A small phosphatase-like protein